MLTILWTPASLCICKRSSADAPRALVQGDGHFAPYDHSGTTYAKGDREEKILAMLRCYLRKKAAAGASSGEGGGAVPATLPETGTRHGYLVSIRNMRPGRAIDLICKVRPGRGD